MNAYDILKERGFVAQVTFEDDLRKAFDEGMVTFYTGFDPTADSLHIGHYIPIMAMAHLQRAGHKPIALMGGGTGMIGLPSLHVDENGHLICTYAGEPPPLSIDEQGHLIYTYGGD